MMENERLKDIAPTAQPQQMTSFESQLAPSVRPPGRSRLGSEEGARGRTASISHDVPSPGTSSQLRDWDSRTSHARRNCSVEFQHLLDRLLHQHILEVSEGGSSSGGGLHTRTTRTTERSSMESIRGSHRSSLNMMDNMKTLTENVRRRKMEEMPEVHASRILAEWDHGTEANEASFTSSIVKEQKTTAKSEMTVHFEDRVAVSETIKFDLLITALVGLNVLWMAIQLQVHGFKVACDIGMYCEQWLSEDFESRMASYFLIGDAIFAFIFAADVTFRLCALRSKFWRRWINWLDLAVSITCLIEILVVIFTTTGSNLVILRILRFARLARAVRVVAMSAHLASFQLLIKCLIACKGMLLWSFILLAFVQCVAGLVVSSLCWDFIQDPFQSEEHRQEVFLYYGSFSRTTLTLFEILFANWAPACRVLVENVSEWFSIFFLAYRCVLGFAILNVVNAVFVQQTMKTASSDEELAFRQKERDIVSYNRKVRRLFQSIDSSGDGSITLEEFEKLVTSPKLRFWMSQLELEYHDLLSLFEFLDNGDGVITLTEFIEGAARLRGQAKALDVWRMETKVEILFEEVLFALKMNGFAMSNVDHNMSGASNNSEEPFPHDRGASRAESLVSVPLDRTSQSDSVRGDVFQNSNWRHIKCPFSERWFRMGLFLGFDGGVLMVQTEVLGMVSFFNHCCAGLSNATWTWLLGATKWCKDGPRSRAEGLTVKTTRPVAAGEAKRGRHEVGRPELTISYISKPWCDLARPARRRYLRLDREE
ncbi:Cation channel sperm-associated protein 1 [Durusdinium trenchii]|uniref:Cation channel sperm-associated protein 1 n=1 Tax=Durusdinium trenchii TaxID=1381693 RepID=A0ABP0SRV9_9DINO